jgi:AbrB family transcriptional regulator (stage V sporulation protein T)
MPKPGEHKYCEACPILEDDGECQFTAQVIAPIIAEGDPIGAVILTSKEPGVVMGELEVKIAETAAGFLAKQMEQ